MRKTKQIILCATLAASLLGGATVQANEVRMNPLIFSDVPSNHWAQSAIEWGVQQKITSGYEDGTFKPNKGVTEEEFITLLVRAYGVETSTETGQRWSDPYYRVAIANNLPVSEARTVSITRQSVANIIVGTQGVNFLGDDAVQYLLNKGLTKGKTAPTIEGFKGTDTLARAEAITFIKNIMDKLADKTILARPKEPSPKSLLEVSDQKRAKENNDAKTPSTDPTLESTSKPILKMDNFISSFNESLENFKISNDYKLDAEKLETKVTPEFTSYLFSKWNYIPNAYIFYAVAKADTGQITMSFTIYGGIAKSIAANAIATYVQDKVLGNELCEKSGIIKAIDHADLTGSQDPIVFSSNGYDIRYMYDKKVHSHAVSINQVTKT